MTQLFTQQEVICSLLTGYWYKNRNTVMFLLHQSYNKTVGVWYQTWFFTTSISVSSGRSDRSKRRFLLLKAHLHPATVTRLWHHFDITSKSIPCILVWTVTPGRSDIAVTSLKCCSQMALQPICERRRSDVADADTSLDVNGPLLL